MPRCGDGPSANCLALSLPESSSHPKFKPVFSGRNKSPSEVTELLNEEFWKIIQEKVVGGSWERLLVSDLSAPTG